MTTQERCVNAYAADDRCSGCHKIRLAPDTTYDTLPSDLTNQAGQKIGAGGTDYTVVTTIYANDLSTDIDPSRSDDEVSIGLICQLRSVSTAQSE